jgi:type I restriction enzyme, S subunit
MSSKGKSSAARDSASTPGPNLRFPEFQEASSWRTTKLNSLLFEAKHRNKSLELGPADVLSVSGEHGCVNQIEFMGRSYAGVTVKDYHVVERGDIVYTKSPLKNNPFGIIKENKWKRGIVSTLYAVYRPFPECFPTYLDHFFSVDYHLNSYLQPIVRKGAKNDMKVNNADVLKGDICVPDLPEQQKIADCLDSADALIAAQGRKVEALKAHKKGLMQQLFPQEGETQPRLRFPEFEGAGEWVEEPLNSSLSRVIDYRGKAPPKSESGVPLITAKNVRLGWLDMRNDEYIDAEQYDTWMSRGIPRAGDVLFTTEAPLGNVALFPREGKFAVGQRLLTLRSNPKKCLSSFLFQSLLGPRMQGKIDFHSTGSTAKGIKSSVFVNIPFIRPRDVAEQQRIADCLTSLDDIIAAETRKLDALKTHKKGLMQQLFPQVGEDDA